MPTVNSIARGEPRACLRQLTSFCLALASVTLGACSSSEPTAGTETGGMEVEGGSSSPGAADRPKRDAEADSAKAPSRPRLDAGGVEQPTASQDPTSCASTSAEAEPVFIPTDVIWAIDTTGTMSASLPSIQRALIEFSSKVVTAGVDAHIVLLANASGVGPGAPSPLCVPAPLGSGSCGAASTAGGVAPDSREPALLHLDVSIGMSQGIPSLLDNYERYKHVLRPNARTQLVVTEDGMPLVSAEAVTRHIEGEAGATFGAAWNPPLEAGSYQWNAVVCAKGNTFGPCITAFGIPQTTLDLVEQTQGLLGDLDEAGQSGKDPFGALLTKLAEQVIVGNRVGCSYPIPQAPSGQTFDKGRVNVAYTSSGNRTLFGQIPEGEECSDGALGWKYDDPKLPTSVELCPAACAAVQGDVNAEVDVEFGCETILLL